MATHRLGRYTLLQELATGGMARVYAAQKDGAEGVCVLKQLLVELKHEEFAAKRFYREAHIASFLDHPNIARLLDAGFEDDSFCIAMELIAGADLEKIIRALGGTMPWELATAIAVYLLDALAYAHDALDPEGQPLQVVHRDIAPRNVMISFQGEVKLIDFGLARGKVGDFMTEPGIIVGTLRYLSPEQARSEEVDRRSDIYSLGVVMHELFTGHKVVTEKTPLGVLRAIMNDTPPLMREINASVPAGIEIAIAKALEKSPEDRWQTAGELRDAIVDAVGASFARAQTPKLGELVRKLFPEDERKTAVLRELGRTRFASVYGSNGFAGTLSESSPKVVVPRPERNTPPGVRMGSTPWSALDEAQRQLAQPDALTRPELPPQRSTSGIDPKTDPGGSPPIPRPRSLKSAITSDPRGRVDHVDADTVPITLPPPPAQPPHVAVDMGEEPTMPPQDPRALAAATPPPAPDVSRPRERAQPIIPDPADGSYSRNTSRRLHRDPALEEETAIARPPPVQRRPQNRLFVLALITGAAALLLVLALAFDRCA